MMSTERYLDISIAEQRLKVFENGVAVESYPVSTAKNGPGERMGS